ncbi:hypothetical protein H5T87_09145 [bacterium]|nr:hypothetical protein [bacterium]
MDIIYNLKLDGVWKLLTDPSNRGKEEGWFKAIPKEAKDAPVPGIIQQVFPDYHGVAWYWRYFTPLIGNITTKRAILRFWAVDYLADVWLNGIYMGGHEGGETPFQLDITNAVRPNQPNLLAVRVLNPTSQPIDGIVLSQVPHRNKIPQGLIPGSSYNYGGIVQPVEFLLVPSVRITDVFPQPNIHTGELKVTFTLHNDLDSTVEGNIILSLSPNKEPDIVLASDSLDSQFSPGDNLFETSLFVTNPHLWSLDDPFLYRLRVDLRASSGEMKFNHSYSVRTGYRELRVENGYFHLNGKRLFIRSTHTGNQFPIGHCVPPNQDLIRRDLLYAKALGFNMVRFIAGMALPQQLDFCDEIGLMVYEENMASWCLEDSPKMKERYNNSLKEMILRDRNHPSVVIWGLLNETPDGPVFRNAVEALSLVRSLDNTRLVLLNSGRWDRQLNIGSLSNPGSKVWEYHWGIETPEANEAPPLSLPYGGYISGAGDAHIYPPVPQTKEINDFFRRLGSDSKPVFISEYGIGSLFNAIRELRFFEQSGISLDVPDASLIRSMAERFQEDWRRWGFEGTYSFPEDMLRESQRLHCKQRTLGFNLIRSNPKICGYSMTGMLDHGIIGEGLWTLWRELKPGIADTLLDGFAPIRWCLFVEPAHTYSKHPLKLEAVLANEDVLQPGNYNATFRIIGPNGIVWEKKLDFSIPQPPDDHEPPLAIPLLEEEISIDGPTGKYIFSANLEKGGAPTGGRIEFFLTNPMDFPKLDCSVILLGIDEVVKSWLIANGVCCKEFTYQKLASKEIILVGNLDVDEIIWNKLMKKIEEGSIAIFLNPTVFRKGDDSLYWLPLKKKGRCYAFYDWLYHKECIAKQHPIFSNLPTGIMDWDYYGPLIPALIFEELEDPEEVIAAAFAISYPLPGGYTSGLLLASYRYGKGRFIINSLPILENISIHPAADRLLLNLIQTAKAWL